MARISTQSVEYAVVFLKVIREKDGTITSSTVVGGTCLTEQEISNGFESVPKSATDWYKMPYGDFLDVEPADLATVPAGHPLTAIVR